MSKLKHNKFMLEAVKLARLGEGRTRPNPPVGALVVANGKVVGKGYHKKAGGPHAEVTALEKAGKLSKGASLYITLEPCSSHGQTPPCVNMIIESKIAQVVIAVRDPNPKHRGRGIRILKKAGIEVIENICKDESSELIAPFKKHITSGKPFLTLKLGMTLDGRIADESGKSKWITCAKSRKVVHSIRKRADAVMVGSKTAYTDNPSLLVAGASSLYRIIIDSAGKLPLSAKVLNDRKERQTIIATTTACSKSRIRSYESKGASVWVFPQTKNGVSLKRLFARIGKFGLMHILCEGGGELAYGLIKAGLVDEYLLFVAPRMLGGKAVPAVGGKGWTLNLAPKLKVISCETIGDDVLIRAK